MSLLCEIKFPSLANEMLAGICRCCLSNGYNKDSMHAFSWLGEDEIYCEMLIDCFNIKISDHNSSILEQYLICDICITRLREAAKFKEQVIAAQINYQSIVTQGLKNRFGIDEIVKIEKEVEDEMDLDNDDDTFIINQKPITKTAQQKTSFNDKENICLTEKKHDSNLCWANKPLIICQTCGNTYSSMEQYLKHQKSVFDTKINIEKSLCKNPNRIVTSFTDVCDWDLLNECKHVAVNRNMKLRDRRLIANKQNCENICVEIGNSKRLLSKLSKR